MVMQLQLSDASCCKRNWECVCHPLAMEHRTVASAQEEEEEGKLVMCTLSVLQQLYVSQSRPQRAGGQRGSSPLTGWLWQC